MGLIFHCHPSRSSLQQVQFLPAFRNRASYADFISILFLQCIFPLLTISSPCNVTSTSILAQRILSISTLNLMVLSSALKTYKHQGVFVITQRGCLIVPSFNSLSLIQYGVIKV